jgi:hypothetical protein
MSLQNAADVLCLRYGREWQSTVEEFSRIYQILRENCVDMDSDIEMAQLDQMIAEIVGE